MIRSVPTGDLGLDVLLGGGWRLIKRFEDKESATVIVRGGSGAGKTLVGIQAALELARALGGDVAVGCVEILPTEYIAQLQSARPSLPAERIAHLPARPASQDGPRVYVGLLKLEGDEPDLVTALEQLEAAVRVAGGNPTAFIVDSLIDGYGIGSSVDRIVADDVLRFAANYGYGLVLCEEITSDTASPWVFAADTVLQVGVESRERGRWIEVKKHRFGPSATGRHELDLAEAQRPQVFPSSGALGHRGVGWILDNHNWKHSGDACPSPILQFQGVSPNDTATLPTLTGLFVYVSAHDPEVAQSIASSLRRRVPQTHRTLLLELDPLFAGLVQWLPGPVEGSYIPAARGPARALRAFIERFGAVLNRGAVPHLERVLLGDLGLVLDGVDGNAWAESVRTFVSLIVAANWGVPVIAYDGEGAAPSAARASIKAQADVSIDVNVHMQATVRERWPRRTHYLNLDPALPRQREIDSAPRPFGRGEKPEQVF